MSAWDYGFDYAIDPTETTPEGIRVDRSGQTAPTLEQIDELTDAVEACLRAAPITCGRPDPVINRGCFSVKVPNDWAMSCAGDWQVLRDRAPEIGCLAKGETPSPECPCRWRAGIQETAFVVTPSLLLYPDVLIRAATGCPNPWAVPELAKCASLRLP